MSLTTQNKRLVWRQMLKKGKKEAKRRPRQGMKRNARLQMNWENKQKTAGADEVSGGSVTNDYEEQVWVGGARLRRNELVAQETHRKKITQNRK